MGLVFRTGSFSVNENSPCRIDATDLLFLVYQTPSSSSIKCRKAINIVWSLIFFHRLNRLFWLFKTFFPCFHVLHRKQEDDECTLVHYIPANGQADTKLTIDNRIALFMRSQVLPPALIMTITNTVNRFAETRSRRGSRERAVHGGGIHNNAKVST